ncbi:hypothetical protein F4810DRAFT_696975 [Camillea tinctor]|nr:hypothetical protein F4810DRAFT_696975 [Camillea tinctor]
MINQVWIWIIDEKTIITATTEDSSQESVQNLLQKTLENISYGDARSRFERPTSVQSVMELVLGVATRSFMEKSIIIPSSEHQMKKSPIEVFRESLRDVVDGESQLFQHFLDGLRGQTSGPDPSGERTRQDSSKIIIHETELLNQTRDIRDELHILKSLAEDQDVAWKQAFPSRDPKNEQFQYHATPPGDTPHLAIQQN